LIKEATLLSDSSVTISLSVSNNRECSAAII